MQYRLLSRRLLVQSTGILTAVIAVARPARLLAQTKSSQQAVRYQDARKDGQRCDGCRLFVEPASCQRVEGEISPQGWCQLFTPK